MKAEYLNAFIKSTLYALDATMKTTGTRKDLKAAKPGEKPTVGHIPGRNWILAGCDMEGGLCGHLSLSIQDKTAIPLVAKMVEEKIGEVTPIVKDGIAELANIIAGTAQGFIGQQVDSVTLPEITVGETIDIKIPPAMPSFRLVFDTEYGSFNIDVALEEATVTS